MPIHSDLCENSAGSKHWCCWRGLHRASISASSLRGGIEVKSLPSALEGMPKGGDVLLRNCAMLVLVPSTLGTKRGKRKRKKTLQLMQKLSSGSYQHSFCSECWHYCCSKMCSHTVYPRTNNAVELHCKTSALQPRNALFNSQR